MARKNHRSVKMSAVLPRLQSRSDGAPAPGCRVRETAPEYAGTAVHHLLYLPTNWRPERRFPVIVEYAGNESPEHHCTGLIEDCRLGFGQTGGEDFIWLVLPFVSADGQTNQTQWWGDRERTIAYALVNVPRICARYGGDPQAIFLTGFSRGAIAVGYIGLANDAIAGLWRGFLPHSHHDGGSFTGAGAEERLARVAGRPSFITYGEFDDGRGNSLIGAAYLRQRGFPVETRELPGHGHTDRWLDSDSPTRREIREWLKRYAQARNAELERFDKISCREESIVVSR
jgi:predicted esterase